MGAHGIGLFDDDDGADFAAEVLESESVDIIWDALRTIPVIESEYVDHPDGMRALVAAEIIADQLGRETGSLSDDLHSWGANFGDPPSEIVSLAHTAVVRVMTNSETRDLWRDSPQFPDWLQKTRDLADRLV